MQTFIKCERVVNELRDELVTLEEAGKKDSKEYKSLEKQLKKKEIPYEEAKKAVEKFDAGDTSRSPSPQADAGKKEKKGSEGKDTKDAKSQKKLFGGALKRKKTQ